MPVLRALSMSAVPEFLSTRLDVKLEEAESGLSEAVTPVADVLASQDKARMGAALEDICSRAAAYSSAAGELTAAFDAAVAASKPASQRTWSSSGARGGPPGGTDDERQAAAVILAMQTHR